MPFYIQVYNHAANEQVSFERISPETLAEALAYKEQVKAQYRAIGCHEVRLLVELHPDEVEETEYCDFCKKDKPSEGFTDMSLKYHRL